jgi:hypothetical protein
MTFHIWNLSNHEGEVLKTSNGAQFKYNLGHSRGMWWQARTTAGDKVLFESDSAVDFAYLLNMADCQIVAK